MSRTVKIAISLPQDTMTQVENVRHKLGLPRSRAIVEAVRLWLKKMEEDAMDRKYIEGYRRRPEEPAQFNPLVMAGLASFSKDKW